MTSRGTARGEVKSSQCYCVTAMYSMGLTFSRSTTLQAVLDSFVGYDERASKVSTITVNDITYKVISKHNDRPWHLTAVNVGF